MFEDLSGPIHHSVEELFDFSRQCRSGNIRLPILQEWQRAFLEIRQIFLAIREQWDEAQKISPNVQSILRGLRDREQELLDNNESLREKENRFDFLVSALEEFINGNYGLRYPYNLLVPFLLTEPGDQARIEAEREAIYTFLTHYEWHLTDAWDVDVGIHEIINSTIYEILNLFNFDITPTQVPSNAHFTTHFNLLQELYKETKKENQRLRLPETKPKSPGRKSINDALHYKYSSALRAGDIRLLEILPGSGEDQIKCRLEVHELGEDVIPEALSYVWGSPCQERKKILVDEKDFDVFVNLYGILQALRNTSTARIIWIDAICINQADEQEKGHQVRLMRKIYSKAKTTTVWLGDSSRNQDRSFGTAPWFIPLPPRFGGYNIDEGDLVAIVDECLKNRIDKKWDEKQWAIYIMLIRCMAQIQLNEWWERVWTIQEAALPPKAPDFLFKGRLISFDALIAGDRIRQSIMEHGQVTCPRSVMGEQVMHVLSRLVTVRRAAVRRLPFLMSYRKDQCSHTLNTFTDLLSFTASYEATNPLDNIFALSSLLPEYRGKLIKVDYTEHYSDVFKRATARSFNSTARLDLMDRFNFLFETALRRQKDSQEQPHVPSWVLDLTYSDIGLRGGLLSLMATNRATVEEFISEHQVPRIDMDGRADYVCFATPTTLFCTGSYIDEIYESFEIPSVGDDNPIGDLLRFLTPIYTAHHQLREKPPPEDIRERIPKHDSEDFTLFRSLLYFFSLQWEEMISVGSIRDLVKTRNREAAGKPAIVTKTGLIGIGTAPVLPGDYLCCLHSAPVYLILRRVEDLDGVEKHRIVSRVALLEAPPDMMRKRIESLPKRCFQII